MLASDDLEKRQEANAKAIAALPALLKLAEYAFLCADFHRLPHLGLEAKKTLMEAGYTF